MLLDLDTYMQTVICTQKTDVLVLEMKHYERLLAKRNPRTIDKMMENLEVMAACGLTFRSSDGQLLRSRAGQEDMS